NIKICVLEKKRGNFSIQEKFAKNMELIDTTSQEVQHHVDALNEAGYDVIKLKWNDSIISDLKKMKVDLIFNVSSIVETAILDELKMPYVGSDVIGSVIATDKALIKNLWIMNKLQTSPFILAKTLKDCDIFEEEKPFNYPLFIKPSQGRGSSGIDKTSFITSFKDLQEQVKKRLITINQPVLIEKFLEGREITCGIIGNGENIRALPLLEIIHEGKNKFLTFDKKELDDDIFQCPAKLTQNQTEQIQKLAISAFRVAGLRDYGRVDLILTKKGPFLLEINSFAGLMCTPIEKPHSYIGFMAKAEHKRGSELIDEIVKAALIRIQDQ
ncbi:MAG: D-alanine--D-alanine ligase family protein, partial [Promethearchaeota archaeon]